MLYFGKYQSMRKPNLKVYAFVFLNLEEKWWFFDFINFMGLAVFDQFFSFLDFLLSLTLQLLIWILLSIADISLSNSVYIQITLSEILNIKVNSMVILIRISIK